LNVLIPQPIHLAQHAGTTFRQFFDDTFAFFPGAVLHKEFVGLKPDKLRVLGKTRTRKLIDTVWYVEKVTDMRGLRPSLQALRPLP
jgi:hypothetical protein